MRLNLYNFYYVVGEAITTDTCLHDTWENIELQLTDSILHNCSELVNNPSNFINISDMNDSNIIIIPSSNDDNELNDRGIYISINIIRNNI